MGWTRSTSCRRRLSAARLRCTDNWDRASSKAPMKRHWQLSWKVPASTLDTNLSTPSFIRGVEIGEYRLDLLVENEVVVEIKSVERFDPIFEAQLLTYLRVTGKRVGLLINFNSRLLRDGIKRFIR